MSVAQQDHVIVEVANIGSLTADEKTALRAKFGLGVLPETLIYDGTSEGYFRCLSWLKTDNAQTISVVSGAAIAALDIKA